MYFDTKKIEILTFKNESHVNNHLNYLFRTDRGQKWTNQYTDGNMIIFGDERYLIGDSFDRRHAAKKVIQEFIQKRGLDYNHMYMCRIECPDSKVFFFNEAILEEVTDIMRGLNEELARENKRIMLGITHEDQIREYMHFHLLIYDIDW